MLINYLKNEGNASIALVSINDLKAFALDIIQQTKRELEELVISQKSEMYVSRQKACEMLDVNSTTIWRWSKKNYLVPIFIGGKRRFKVSDINRLLNKNLN